MNKLGTLLRDTSTLYTDKPSVTIGVIHGPYTICDFYVSNLLTLSSTY